MVQNNEKRRVSWLTSRMDHVEDELKTIGDAVKSSVEKTQGRFDSLTNMMQQVFSKRKSRRQSDEKTLALLQKQRLWIILIIVQCKGMYHPS